jgi:hypothetical protein
MNTILKMCKAPHPIHEIIPDDKHKEYQIHKSDAVNSLTRYVNLIYKYLNAIEMCFTTGSFVIEDSLEKLLDVLIVSSSTGLEGIFASHTSLNPKKFEKTIHGITYISKRVNETHIYSKIDGENEGIPISCSHLRDNDGHLIIDHRYAQNIKWYKFLNGSEKDFVFFKLERYKTCHKEHLANAGNHYVRNKKTKSEYTSRREDCKDKCVYLKDSSMKKNIDEIVIEGKSYRIDENYNRVGDEFFIPQVLNEYFLKLIDKNIDIDYDIKIIKEHYDDTKKDVVTITVEHKHIGKGGRKKRVLKKKILQKNN